MSTKRAFKQSIAGGDGAAKLPGIFDIGSMGRKATDILADLDPQAAMRTLKERYTIVPKCQQFTAADPTAAADYATICALQVDGSVIITDRKIEFSANLGSFVIFLEWMELTMKPHYALMRERAAEDRAAEYGSAGDPLGIGDNEDDPTDGEEYDAELVDFDAPIEDYDEDEPRDDPDPDDMFSVLPRTEAKPKQRASRTSEPDIYAPPHAPQRAFDDDPW